MSKGSSFTRRLYCIGDVGTPDTSDHTAYLSLSRYPVLHTLWQMSAEKGKLFYCVDSNTTIASADVGSRTDEDDKRKEAGEEVDPTTTAGNRKVTPPPSLINKKEEKEEEKEKRSTSTRGDSTMRSQANVGAMYGLYALKHATLGSATQGMDAAFQHVASLDFCFGTSTSQTEKKSPVDENENNIKNVPKVVRIAGLCETSGVLLLSNGVMLSLSPNPRSHGFVITLPPFEKSENVAANNEEEKGKEEDSSRLNAVVDVSGGEGHFVCCDRYGCVYTWGWKNDLGQLGRGFISPCDPSKIGVHEPVRLPGFGRMMHRNGQQKKKNDSKNSTDATSTEAVNEDDDITGGEREFYSVFEQRPAPFICAVACGRNHSVLLNVERNCVYTFGHGFHGQLGHGRPFPSARNRMVICPVPRAVQTVFGNEISQIASCPNGDHTLILCGSGELIAFGDNVNGVCGTGSTKTAFAPTSAKFSTSTSSSTGTAVAAHDDKKTTERKENGGAGEEEEEERIPTAKEAMIKPIQPYGTAESYLFPRRVRELQPRSYTGVVEKYKLGHPYIFYVSTSATHTAVLAKKAASSSSSEGSERYSSNIAVFTCGLRPVKTAALQKTMYIDNLGCLGRTLQKSKDALVFDAMQKYQREEIDGVLSGRGFTVMWKKGKANSKNNNNNNNNDDDEDDHITTSTSIMNPKATTANGCIWLHGTIRSPTGQLIVSTGMKRPFPAETAPGEDELAAIPVRLGPNQRVVDCFAAAAGVILTVDTYH